MGYCIRNLAKTLEYQQFISYSRVCNLPMGGRYIHHRNVFFQKLFVILPVEDSGYSRGVLNLRIRKFPGGLRLRIVEFPGGIKSHISEIPGGS